MKKFATMSGAELVALYTQIGVAQAEALDRFESGRFNRLFDQEMAIVNELRSRPGDRRTQLFALYEHPNLQVRLNAAQSTYMLNRARAHAVLEEIAETRWLPQAATAAFSLEGIAAGDSALLRDPWIPSSRKERLALHQAELNASKD